MRRFHLSAEGWVREARHIPSPNCDERPPGAAIELLLIHNISLPPGEFGGPGIIELFTNRLDATAHPYYQGIAHLRVAAHFLIRREGELIQFVPCAQRAWHAGASHWRGRERCNDFSIGVELEGTDTSGYSEAQYATLAALTLSLAAQYPLVAAAGHAEVAPGRKTDPGPSFDWSRLPRLERDSGELDRKANRGDNKKLC